MKDRPAVRVACIMALSLWLPAGKAADAISTEQRTWIANHPVVRYGSDVGWRPIVDEENGKAVGIVPQFLDLIGKQTGLRFVYVHTASPEDALARFQRGELDILPGIDTVHLPHFGAQQPLLTRTFFSSPLVFIGQATAPLAFGLADLKGKRVAMRERAGSWIPASALGDVTVIRVRTTDEALNTVARGDADYLIGADALYPAFIRSHYVGSLGVAGTLDAPPMEMKIAVRADAPLLRDILDQAIGRLTAQQTDILYDEALSQVQYGAPSLGAILYYRRWEAGLLLALLGGLLVAALVAARARARARDSEAVKTRFLAMMSHEIRTPVNVMVGTLESLEQYPLAAPQRHLVETMSLCADTLVDLLDNVLDLSKLEAGKVALEHVAVDPIALLESVQRLMNMRARGKGLTLVLDTHGVPTTRVLLDTTRVRQVLTNLVGNAIKFTSTGGVTIRVRHERKRGVAPAAGTPPGRPRTDTLLIDVIDTGIGIPFARQSSLFQPYTQADSSTTRHYGGTGLGLSICRELVLLMGGHISLRSSEGVGTLVSVSLPYVLADDALPATGAPPATPPAHAGHVLVVDDNPLNREVLSRQLEMLGVVSYSAADGNLAVLRARQGGIDLILMDCFMPEMDGYQTTEALRREGITTPVIAVSAANDAEHLQRCMDAGMNGVLKKPLRTPQLASLLAMWQVTVTLPATTAPAAVVPAAALVEPSIDDIPLGDYMRDDLGRLEGALVDGDAAAVRFHAHRLKGSALLGGAADVAAAVAAIEAATGASSPAHRPALAPEQLEALRQAIEAWAAREA